MAIRKSAQKDESHPVVKPTSPTHFRGPVDAPGKRHREPVLQEAIAKRMGEPRGKQMGQKSAKAGLACRPRLTPFVPRDKQGRTTWMVLSPCAQ
jgi:hypothetical protein